MAERRRSRREILIHRDSIQLREVQQGESGRWPCFFVDGQKNCPCSGLHRCSLRGGTEECVSRALAGFHLRGRPSSPLRQCEEGVAGSGGSRQRKPLGNL